jgi:glycosyltransferase involved in cell wall biosynthesis
MTTAITTCICTMNRPGELEAALRSLGACRPRPDQIIVSDDSPESDRRSESVCGHFAEVVYLRGPRRGLGANRNAAVSAVTGSWVHFIDDDVIVPADFYEIAHGVIESSTRRAMISGIERRHASDADPSPVRVTPPYAGFWAHLLPAGARSPNCVVINAALFPRELLTETKFDERLKYGCEESDMTCHALANDYVLLSEPRLVVDHYPSTQNRSIYGNWVVASQVHAGLKRQWLYRQSGIRTVGYLILAVPRLVLYHFKSGGLSGGTSASIQAVRGLGYFAALLRSGRAA